MNDFSIGAVGAAAIAGLVSLLGLVIAKEQKVSEFRQNWIDELRKSIISYLVNINAISDTLRLRKAGKQIDEMNLLASYKSLNEASHGIRLRVNAKEKPAKMLLDAMSEFQALASDNASLTPEGIKAVEDKFLFSSTELLKFEWIRVKRGEATFVATKYLVIAIVIFLVGVIGTNSLRAPYPPSNQFNIIPRLQPA